MAFHVYVDHQKNSYDDWWEMIEFVKNYGEEHIAHNPNDVHAYYNCGKFRLVPIDRYDPDYIVERAYFLLSGQEDPPFFERVRTVSPRNLMVLDDYGRVINLTELRDSIKIFKPRPKHRRYSWFGPKYFDYRVDPVPYTGKYSRYRRWRDVSSNKNYYLNVMSQWDDSRIRTQFALKSAGFWADGLPRFSQRSWKEQGKKKKQWM